MTHWITTVQEDPNTGDAIIEFPDDLLAAVGWKEGDTLNWKVEEDGTCILTKVEKSAE
jgi:bifunctional DNA-binding transcriptional regulator/antitoxin component of YhaV-PrlF toxin-antitoxin module